MGTRRTQTIVLCAVLAVLAVVLWYQARTPAGTAAPASNGERPRATSGAPGQTSTSAVAQVKVDELAAPRPAPGGNDRNPFQFKPKAPPPPPPAPKPTVPQPMISEVVPPVDTGPPPPPPIRVKFIGVVEKEGKKIAVLSEGGNVFSGVEGQIADGRFLIIKIGVESIELSYPDGRGRTTIRLSGS